MAFFTDPLGAISETVLGYGQANIQIGQASVAVTIPGLKTTDIAFASLGFVDATALYVKAAVCTANTLTITANANATAITAVNYVVLRP